MPQYRLFRLQDRIKKDVSDILLADIRDPRIGFVTITRVSLTPDMRYAKVMFSLLGEETSVSRTLEGLASATGTIRTLLGKRLGIKRVPELRFVHDRGIEHSLKMQEILDDIDFDAEDSEISETPGEENSLE